ncbi:MAG: hypothetical protein H0T84_02850 [Tatlockia sp.]|nr:hypothetical protein [Tatlockia sp.]
MSWLETEGEKAFRDALAKEVSFLNIVVSKAVQEKKYETVAKGNNFLKSIRELKILTHTSTHKFYEQFVNAATNTVLSRSKENFDELYLLLIQYRGEMEDSNITNQATGGWNVAVHSLSFTASIGAAALGSTALYFAIWSTATLALGPWGVAAIGVALILTGLVIASYEAYKIYQNGRLFRDSQLQEITDFVIHLDPDITPKKSLLNNAANHPYHNSHDDELSSDEENDNNNDLEANTY